MNDIKFPLQIVNEDGTSIDNYPKNPLKEKWEKLYSTDVFGRDCSPIDGYKKDGTPYMNYTCVLCQSRTCYNSNYFEIPEEDKEVWNEYQRRIDEYDKVHNPSILKYKRRRYEANNE